jgi:N-carbamoylputrescine amidase
LSIGIVQMAMAEEATENDRRAEQGIRDAAARGASIVCLPELYRSPYFCQSEDTEKFALAEPIPGETTDRLCSLARELRISIVASLFERRAAGVYHNTAAVIAPDQGFLGIYRKMHIPDDPRYYEKFFFTPGDLGFKVFATPTATIGVLVCWDQWYPEAARLTALKGAEILIYPTAIGWHPEEKLSNGAAQHDAWELVQRSHAVANGCFVVAANRVGFEAGSDGGGIEFWGQSFIAAPDGSVIARAPADSSAVVVETIDLSAIERSRQGWPFLRDRRIDAYGGLTERLLDK